MVRAPSNLRIARSRPSRRGSSFLIENEYGKDNSKALRIRIDKNATPLSIFDPQQYNLEIDVHGHGGRLWPCPFFTDATTCEVDATLDTRVDEHPPRHQLRAGRAHGDAR